MRDLLSWNLSLGRWGGIHVRLHVFFLLFALIALNFSWQEQMFPFGVACLGLLLVSTLAHEFGHCAAAYHVGGGADQILLWPLGGLAHVNVSQDPQNEFVTSIVGPLVNAVACVPLGLAVTLMGGNVLTLLNPLVPPVPVGPEAITPLLVVEVAFWMNFLLAWVNLLPAFPLDGSRIWRAVLWPKTGYRTAVLLVVRAAKVVAFGLCIAAWLVHTDHPDAWLPLLLLAMLVFFAAKQEAERLNDSEPAESSFAYDFSQGYTSLERQMHGRSRDPGPMRRWLDRRREERARRQQQIEQDEERRVDEILARLHSGGREGLSAEDRALLDRVSARYRGRQRG